MNAIEFKSALKGIKNNLVGMTLQFKTPSKVSPYYSLSSFGNAVLDSESNCNSYHPTQIWTSEGIKSVTSFNHLIELLKSFKTSAISFSARHQSGCIGDSIRLGGSLD
jgi:hypothetical protein